jgi:hypothetical protein
LIRDGAGRLAGGLAGSLAFAAPAFRGGLFQISLVYGDDMFHDDKQLLIRSASPKTARFHILFILS